MKATVSPPLEILNPLTHRDWDDLLAASGDHQFFHTAAWARVLNESYHYVPLYFSLVEQNELKVLLPVMEICSFFTGRRGVSLPFTDYCEPLIRTGIPHDEIIRAILEFGKRSNWNFWELRGGKAYLPGARPASFYFVHSLDLTPGEEALFPGFRDSTRRNIQKAQKYGVEIRLAHSPEAMEAYYQLHCLTRKRHCLPPQPLYFFRKIFEHILQDQRGFVALGVHRNRVVAGAIFFHFHQQVLFKFGASDLAFQHVRANNLVMWRAIQWACAHGARTFCLGRTAPANTGLIQYKDGWRARKYCINYYRYDLKTTSFVPNGQKNGDRGHLIFRNMSIPLLKITGKILYPHVG